jgi:hypothetical protein
MEKEESILGRLIGTVFLLLFAVGFSWFGVATSVPKLAELVGRWYHARSYVAVPASVQSAKLKIIRGETDTESVQASFAYRYRDRDYVSRKVSASALSDNFDSYHRTVYERLRQAQTAGEQVTIWVDPAHPEDALYDRAFRWLPALFLLPFAVLFPAGGLGAWLAIWFLWWGKRDVDRVLGPRELREQSRPGNLAPLAMTLCAFFWNMLSWPMAMLPLVQAQAGRSYWDYLMLLFPLVGLGLVWSAVSMWRTRWRIGKPMLELLQVPAGDQYPLRGRIHFAPAFGARLNTAQLMHRVRIIVKLQQTVGNGEDAIESTLWEKCVLETSLARGATGVDFSVELPPKLPSPGTSQSTRVQWMLELQTLGAEIWFDLPEAGRPAIEAAATTCPDWMKTLI